MSINAELWTPPERRNPMAARRAEAMNRHVELETGKTRAHDIRRSSTALLIRCQVMQRTPDTQTGGRGIDILKKHWRLSTVFALAVTVSVTVATLMMKPVFGPEARVEVDPPGTKQLGG
jgi:hypothetical protein